MTRKGADWPSPARTTNSAGPSRPFIANRTTPSGPGTASAIASGESRRYNVTALTGTPETRAVSVKGRPSAMASFGPSN